MQQQRGWMVRESHQWYWHDVRVAVREIPEAEEQQASSKGIEQGQEVNR